MGFRKGCNDFPSTNPKKWMTRKKWLKAHPEDKPLDRENQIARRRGYDDSDFRQLMAAICLRAIVDYKKASKDPAMAEVAISCHDFFKSEMFQFFVNGMDVETIERIIKETPDSKIHNIWKQTVDPQILQGL